ncbi:response regulator [Ensifer soli]|uniref:response regulator n=1 Tax=Ciceribacter sp. sgz301302 TaxID=3342379 RepID=UPI0035B82739
MTSQKGARLVVVDDEEDVRDMVADYLGQHGFLVRTADGGAALDRCLAEDPADLVLLDVNMPREDGFSIARRLRRQGRTPILMVTANDGIVDRVVGLEIGADDYITKPFDLRELKARIRSVLRRAAMQPEPDRTSAAAPRFGRLTLDLEGRRLVSGDGAEEPLTAMEFDLLRIFAGHPDRPLSREELLAKAHLKAADGADRSIDIRITRLRRKIEADPSKPEVIRTVRGVGYVYTPSRSTP